MLKKKCTNVHSIWVQCQVVSYKKYIQENMKILSNYIQLCEIASVYLSHVAFYVKISYYTETGSQLAVLIAPFLGTTIDYVIVI